MNDDDFPRFADLRKGRVSVKYARYFVTICTRGRRVGLISEEVSTAIRAAWAESHDSGDARTLGAVIMPDHVHWLFRLGDRLTLPRVVAKFKSRTRSALLKSGLEWETNCWEHRLRPEDSSEAFGIYIFMNPYRTRLASADESWPHGWWPDDFNFEFLEHIPPGMTPPASWISEYKRPVGWRLDAQS